MKKDAVGFKTSKMENKKKQETKLALEELIRGIRKPNATHSTKNAEVEGQEHGKDAMGRVTKFVGEKHEDGGMPMQLEDGEKILSDNQKPKKDYAKMLEEKYKVKIAPKDTYASILDKINSKIGFKKIEDEQLKVADKLVKNDKVKDENTKMLNEQAYQKRLGDLEMIKEFKNEKKEEAFDDLYAMQEDGKIENGEYIDEESGVEVKFENGGMMFKKGHLPLLTRVKLANGYRTQEEINNHFSNKFKSGGMKKKYAYAEDGLEFKDADVRLDARNSNNPLAKRHLSVLIPYLQKDENYNTNGLEYDSTSGKFYRNGVQITNPSELSNLKWNPTGDLGISWLTGASQSLQSVSPTFKPQYKDVKSMSMEERKKYVMDLQKSRQDAFKSSFPKTHSVVAKSGVYPATETGLKNLLTELKNDNSESAKYFRNWAKENELIDDKGNVTGGYFTKNSGKHTKEFYEQLDKLENKKAAESFYSGTMNDGRYDKRVENFQQIDFPNVKERDEYAKKYGFEVVNEDDGTITWVDKENANNIYIPTVYRDKFVSKEDMKKWEGLSTIKDFGESKTYKDVGTKGVYERWITDEKGATTNPAPETTTATPATKDEIPLPQRLNNPRYNMSVQHTPPPSGLQLPMLINPQMRDQTFVKISPEQAIRENQRGLNYMGEQLRETESGAQGAAFANLAGKMFEANNEAVSAANIWNVNQRVNYDNEMSKRFDVNENMRQQFLGNYVDKANSAIQNTENDWRTYFMDRDILERKAQKDAQLMNMYEAITPNQNLDPRTGRITYTKPTFGQWINGYNK